MILEIVLEDLWRFVNFNIYHIWIFLSLWQEYLSCRHKKDFTTLAQYFDTEISVVTRPVSCLDFSIAFLKLRKILKQASSPDVSNLHCLLRVHKIITARRRLICGPYRSLETYSFCTPVLFFISRAHKNLSQVFES